MQQRRLRLGDILDDYCPRERRITNHAVVAMIEDEVRQTRCTTCDADHEYKQAKVPASRRKKAGELVLPDLVDAAAPGPALAAASPEPPPEAVFEDVPAIGADAEPEPDPILVEDDGPVHRPLIRATLPRPEGQTPERKAPDFTIRQPGGRFDQQRNNNNGQRHRGRSQGRPQAGQPNGQPPRFGGSRHGAGPGQGGQGGSRPGNRSGNTPGQRGSRPGQNRGPRHGGQGRKRDR